MGTVKPTATIGGPNATIDDAQLGVEDSPGRSSITEGNQAQGGTSSPSSTRVVDSSGAALAKRLFVESQ